MSFRKNLFKNIIVLGSYSYTTQIISFFSSIILSRLLLPSEYGFVALITVFTGFIGMFSDAGLSYIIIRSDYNKLFHSTIHYLAILIGVLIAAIVIAISYPISLFYENPDLVLPTIILSSNFILRSFITVPYGILSKELRFNTLGFIEFVCAVSEIVLMIIMAYFKFSYWALIFPGIIGNFIRIYIYYKHTHLKFRILKMKYLIIGFRKAKSIIGNLTAFNMFNYWSRNADNLIIGKVFGTQSLGIYDRSYKVLNLALGVITGLFGKVLFPSLKDLWKRGGDVSKEYLNTLGIISIMNFPLSVLLIFFSDPLVTLIWSEKWIQVAELLPYIGILILTQTLNSTTGNIYILYGKERLLMLLGIPYDVVVVLAIGAGAFFSVTHILIFYTLVTVGIGLPINMYYGFKKSFGFETKVILYFWVPKVLLSLLLVFTVWFDYKWITVILMFIYLVHLLIDQREDILKTIAFVYDRTIGNHKNKK